MGSIYKITNTVNGKAYIGQTRQDAVADRIPRHFSGHGNIPIKRAVDKYGKDAFTYEILHDGIIPEFLDDLEIKEIEKHNTLIPHGYNLRTGGRGGACSEETKQKISEANKGKTPWNKGKKGVQPPSMKGRKHTDESRLKMSENRKGYTPWNKGISPPEEVRRKISEANKGRPSWMKGKKHTEESKHKMSENRKGYTSWNKGKKVSNPHWLGRKHTDESRRKMSESCKGRIPWNKGKKGLQTAWNKGKKGSTPNWLGRKHTDETRRKMSEATKGQTPWNKGKKGVYTDETRQKISQSKETPECRDARTIFLSLPPQMDLAEKRKHLRRRFPEKSTALIWKWCKKFDSEVYSTTDIP